MFQVQKVRSLGGVRVHVQQIQMMIRASMPSVEQIQRKFTTVQQCTL
jgi:hypothetical protein